MMTRWWYIVWVITEAALVFASVALWLVATEHTVLNLSVSVFTLLLGAILFYPRRVSLVTWLKSREATSAFTQIMRLGLYACIAALVCYLSWKFPLEKDVTERSLNTLSEQSKVILRGLPSDTRLTLYARRKDWTRAMSLLKLYQSERRDLTLHAVDPELQPSVARSQGVQDEGTVVVEGGGKRVAFRLQDELSVTNALLKLVREKKLKLYFTWGHGEPTCENTSQDGISAFCQHLIQQHYDYQRLDLQTSTDVPADADAVIMWGPQTGFLPSEIQRLQRWLEQGGSLLVLYSPLFETDHLMELRKLLAMWGLEARNDLIVDRVSTLETQEATIPLISKYANHPITKNFKERTLYPLSSSVGVGKPLYDKVAVTPIALTSDYPGSWGEIDLKAIGAGKAEFDAKQDARGPLPIISVAERLNETPGEQDTRIAVIGNDVFTRNAYQNQTTNMNLLLNIVGWLAHDEGLISLNRPGLSHEPVILSAQHLRFVFVVTVVTLPLVAFVLALVVFRRRRRL